ncbi:MAG: TlpA family protein disulfide reductase [Fidelibacterota bacterium]
MVRLGTFISLMLFMSGLSAQDDDHEYASIHSSDLEAVRDLLIFDVETLSGETVQILGRIDSTRPPKVFIVSFLAEWCEHCNYEAPFLAKLYSTWRKKGLEMAAIFEYSEREKSQEFMRRYGLSMPFYFGEIRGKLQGKRDITAHYRLRTRLADERGWGTPFHLLFVGDDVKNLYYVAGEFVEEELIKFLGERLGE